MKTTINENSSECIVLKKTAYKENDCLISLYSKDYGKISCVARGVKKLTSKNARGCQQLMLSDMSLNVKKGLSSLIKATPIEYFRHIHEHIESEIVANYIVEYYYRYVEENDPDEDCFNQLYYSLKALNDGYNPMLVYLLFNIFILNINGCMMEVDGCVVCGNKKVVSLSLVDGGFLCDCHYKNQLFDVNTLKAFRHLNKISIEHIDSLHIEDIHIRELSPLIQTFIKDSLGIHLKSVQFIEQI